MELAVRKRKALEPFGPVWDSAGVRGFYREGYWYHPFVPGLSFAGSTFVTKTVTTYPHAGNTPLTSSHRPRHLFPRTVIRYPRKDMVLNAIGLSNPGAITFLTKRHWLSIKEPFFISYAPVLPDDHPQADREIAEFVAVMKQCLDHDLFASKHVGLQLNLSCPNVREETKQESYKLVKKTDAQLDQLAVLGIPIVTKLNLLVKPGLATDIAKHPACTGLCISNSIPFGEVLPEWWWKEHFPNGSPLARRGFGNGGLSGAPLRDQVIGWLRQFRRYDADTYVNAGGGILEPNDVIRLLEQRADSIFVGSVAILRPWRVRKIIACGREI